MGHKSTDIMPYSLAVFQELATLHRNSLWCMLGIGYAGMTHRSLDQREHDDFTLGILVVTSED